MYISKKILGAVVLAAGIIILTALYCFTEMQIPSWCYAAGWIGCLLGMMKCERRIAG